MTDLTKEWLTPPEIINLVLEVFGGEIDLDPCSNLGIPNIPAKKHYDIYSDGLKQKWKGKVFLNPPYGLDVNNWVNKLIREMENFDELILVVAARTDTRWFKKLNKFPWCGVNGRIKFIKYNSLTKTQYENQSSPEFPSAIFYIGKNLQKFISVFSRIGPIWINYTTTTNENKNDSNFKVCSECGLIKSMESYYFKAGKPFKQCKSCIAKLRKTKRKKQIYKNTTIIDPDDLRNMFNEENLSVSEIAYIIGRTPKSTGALLRGFGVDTHARRGKYQRD